MGNLVLVMRFEFSESASVANFRDENWIISEAVGAAEFSGYCSAADAGRLPVIGTVGQNRDRAVFSAAVAGLVDFLNDSCEA